MAEYHFSTFSILQITAAVFAAALSYLAWRRRTMPGSLQLSWVMLAASSWALAYGLEIASTTASQNIFWAKATFLGIHSIPPFFFLLVLEYSQRREWLQRRKLALLWVIPIITIFLVFTNENHALIWNAITPNPDQGNLLIYHYGPWFWASVAYGYVLLVIGTVFLFRLALQISGQYRSQAAILILSVFPPIIANLCYLFQISPFPQQELTPIAFVITGALLAWGMLRHRLFDLTPTAHRKLVDTIPDAVIMVDNQNQIGYINPIAQAIIKIPTKKAIGMPASVVLAHWPYLEKRFQKGTRSYTEIKTIPSTIGRIYDIRISKLAGRRGSYNQGYLIILRDITERRELEKELIAREELYRNVTTNANDGIAIVRDNIVIYSNPQLADLIGQTIEDVENHNLAEFIFPTEVEKVQDRHIRRMRGEEMPSQYRTALQHKTGQSIPVEFSISSLKIDGRQCVLAMVRNISNTLAAEDEINRLAAVVKQTGESVIITDLNGAIVYVNPQFEKNSGYTIEEVRGKNPRLLKSGLHNTNFYRHLWHTITSGETWEGTFINKNKEGQLRYEAAIIFPIKNQTNQVTHYASVKRDITVQIAVEESLKNYIRQQNLLNELTQATIEPLEFQETLQILSKHLGAMISADDCMITLWDTATQEGRIGARYGAGNHKSLENYSCPECLSLTKRSLTDGQPIVIGDVSRSPSIAIDPESDFDARAILVLPLYVDHEKLGAVLLIFNNKHTFTDEEIGLCQQASKQVALAILKAHLLETAELRAEEAETLYLAGRAVTASLNLDDAIEHILNELNRVVPHDSASVQLILDQEVEIIGQRGFPKEDSPLGLKFSLSANTPNAVVVSTRHPYILEDAPLQYKAFYDSPHNHVRGWLGVPLLIRDRIIGLLALDSKQPGQFTKNHARLANAFASQVAIALENARLYEETHRLAITDSVTGMFTRRHFLTLSDREYQRSSRYQRPLSLIMMDLDHFKKVNDNYGHLIGDQVLQMITKLCKDNLREIDIIGRYGGEEFTILLPETPGKTHQSQTDTITSAETVSERLRHVIETTPLKTDNHDINVTVSIGVAELNKQCNDIKSLIDYADQALYQAKRKGRNQVVVWSPNND